MLIRRARPDEAEVLSALAQRSKAWWGYDADFMDRARSQLTIAPADVVRDEIWVLESEAGDPLGFHRVLPGDPAILDDLWLDPAVIGAGHGRRLWEHALEIARGLGARTLELDAEPYALGFYERMGAVQVGSTPSHVEPGRVLPRMRVELV